MNKKIVYCLRTRPDDSSEWSEPVRFHRRKDRDSAASVSRIIGGYRTHSHEERVSAEEAASIEFADA